MKAYRNIVLAICILIGIVYAVFSINSTMSSVSLKESDSNYYELEKIDDKVESEESAEDVKNSDIIPSYKYILTEVVGAIIISIILFFTLWMFPNIVVKYNKTKK